MQATAPSEVGSRLGELSDHDVAGGPTRAAVQYLEELFGRRGRLGIEMATRALRLAVPAERVEAICIAYMRELVATATSG